MTFAIAKPIDLRKDGVTYVRAKLWKKRNQRLSFPVLPSMHEFLRAQGINPIGARLNGIYITVFKCHKGFSTTDFEWVVSLRDVVIDTPDGKRVPFMLKRRNKGHICEFSISDIAETLQLVVKA